MPMTDAEFHRIAKALADPQRFALLERIASDSEVPCRVLVGECSVTQATISHHVKELAAAGLVDVRREGKCCYFSLRSAVWKEYRQELARRIAPPRSVRKLNANGEAQAGEAARPRRAVRRRTAEAKTGE